MRKKSVFIIPGFRQKPKNKAYRVIAKLLKKEGYSPVPVNVSWKQNSIQEKTDLFLKEYKKVRTKEKYILGFSFGAMIALLASTKVEVQGLILCSLSPYFKEDGLGKLECARLARQIKARQILMLYGTREARSLKKRVNETYGYIKSRDKYLMPIKHTEHSIGSKRYLESIHQAAAQLN